MTIQGRCESTVGATSAMSTWQILVAIMFLQFPPAPWCFSVPATHKRTWGSLRAALIWIQAWTTRGIRVRWVAQWKYWWLLNAARLYGSHSGCGGCWTIMWSIIDDYATIITKDHHKHFSKNNLLMNGSEETGVDPKYLFSKKTHMSWPSLITIELRIAIHDHHQPLTMNSTAADIHRKYSLMTAIEPYATIH